MENAGYLLAAFSIVWAAVFGYIFILLHRQKRLRQEIDTLKAVLREKGDNQF